MPHDEKIPAGKSGSLAGHILVGGFLLSILMGEVSSLKIGDRTPLLLYADIYLAGFFFVFAIRTLMRKDPLPVDAPVMALSFVYVSANVVSMLVNGSDLFKGVLALKLFAEGFVLYYMAITLFKKGEDADTVLRLVVAFAAVLSALLVVKYVFAYDPAQSLNKDDIGLGWGMSNYLAAFIAFIIPVATGLAVSKGTAAVRAGAAGALLLMFPALIITMSKGAMLSLALVLGILMPLRLRAGRRLRYFAAAAAAGALLFVVVPRYMPGNIIDENMSLIKQRLANTDNTRLSLLHTSIEDALENPLVGIGPFESVAESRYGMMPHNYVLQVLAELGLAGGIPFMMLIAVFALRAYKNSVSGGTLDHFVFAGCAVTLLHGLVEITFQGMQYMCVFWLVMAAVSVKYRVARLEAGRVTAAAPAV